MEGETMKSAIDDVADVVKGTGSVVKGVAKIG
jgi:hypothetical protein